MYAAISTDTSYKPPPCKHTAAPNVIEVVSEWRMFNILDNLCATATGLDQLPSWFQRLGAPLFYKPLTHLFIVSVSDGVIPHQWKAASIQCQRYPHLPAFPIFTQYLSHQYWAEPLSVSLSGSSSTQHYSHRHRLWSSVTSLHLDPPGPPLLL